MSGRWVKQNYTIYYKIFFIIFLPLPNLSDCKLAYKKVHYCKRQVAKQAAQTFCKNSLDWQSQPPHALFKVRIYFLQNKKHKRLITFCVFLTNLSQLHYFNGFLGAFGGAGVFGSFGSIFCGGVGDFMLAILFPVTFGCEADCKF